LNEAAGVCGGRGRVMGFESTERRPVDSARGVAADHRSGGSCRKPTSLSPAPTIWSSFRLFA